LLFTTGFKTHIDVSDPSFPKPFIITVGVPKGGDCKSWLAFNLASRFGTWGYNVAAIDTNPQHDLLSDHQTLQAKGIWPRFDVIVHDAMDADGNQSQKLDLQNQSHRDILIFDTSQYLQLRSVQWAWRECDLMLMPVTPNTAQHRNYDIAIQLFEAIRQRPCPFVVVPCRVEVLKNASPGKQLRNMLQYLKERGCIVPPFAQEKQIPNSPNMAAQETRWIYDQTMVDRQVKFASDDFLMRVDLTFSWIKYVIEEEYGPMPPPSLPVVPTFDRAELRNYLAQEAQRHAENPILVPANGH
jgi:hypothetical protein